MLTKLFPEIAAWIMIVWGIHTMAHEFVVHLHDATHLHFDLRLLINNKLVSWAVPKGFSFNPRVKRLAIRMPDHSASYKAFEGVIPQGEYGAGPVLIWDKGTFKNIKKDAAGKTVSLKQCLKDGELEIVFDGERLCGAFALVAMKHDEEKWLLIKKKDAFAGTKNLVPSRKSTSVVSGKTVARIAKDER